jgi:hypothetical protein
VLVAASWAVALVVILVGQWFRLHMEGRAAHLTFPLHPDDYRQGPAMLQYAAILGTWVAQNPFAVDRASFSAGLSGFALRTAIGALVFGGLVTLCVRSRRVKAVLREYFRTPGSALDLAVFRILFFGFMFFMISDATVSAASLPADLMVALKDPLPLWRLIRPNPTLMTIAAALFRTGCIAAILGVYPRLAAAIVAVAFFYCEGVGQLFGKVNHSHHLVWTAAVLAASPLGDALSLERFRARRKQGGAAVPPAAPSIAYSRPIRLIWLIMGVVYFYPGFWKAITAGSAWIFTANLQNRMFQKWSDDPSFSPLFRVDHFPVLLALGAFGTLVFELGWIVFVIPRRTRWISIAMGLGFHNMTRMTMNIAFWPLQIMYASFVPWQRLFDRFSARRVATAAPSETTARAERLVPAMNWTGGIILGFALLYGAAHLDTAWPFACFPTFDAYLGDRVHDLGAYYVARDGSERALSEERLTRALGSPRLRTLRRTLVYERNDARRDKALSAFIAGAGPGGADSVAIRLYDEVRSLVPEIRARGPVSRELLRSVKLEAP